MIDFQIEIDALRAEVKHGFAYTNARLDSVDIQLIRHSHELKEIRTEMKQQGEELRAEMRQQGTELRAEMRQLRAEVLEGIKFVMDGMDRIVDELRTEFRADSK